MALEYYVSAEWFTDPVTNFRSIKAIGNDDSVWWIPELMCDVPPWPDFLESQAGKTFAALPQSQEALKKDEQA